MAADRRHSFCFKHPVNFNFAIEPLDPLEKLNCGQPIGLQHGSVLPADSKAAQELNSMPRRV